LVQNVPGYSKNEDLYAISVYLKSMIREIDSSLIDEWEKLKNPNLALQKNRVESVEIPASDPADVTSDSKAFTIMVRNEAFKLVKMLATKDFESCIEVFHPTGGGLDTPEGLSSKLNEYIEAGHSKISMDQAARGKGFIRITPNGTAPQWQVQQILMDPDGHNDWALDLEVDLAASREAGKPVLTLKGFGPL